MLKINNKLLNQYGVFLQEIPLALLRLGILSSVMTNFPRRPDSDHLKILISKKEKANTVTTNFLLTLTEYHF